MQDALTPMMQQYQRLRKSIPGGYAAAVSARRFLRDVFRGREGSVDAAERRADQAQRRADVRRALSRGPRLHRETDQGRPARRDLRSDERAATGKNCRSRDHADHQRRHGQRTELARRQARELSRRGLCGCRRVRFCLRRSQHRRVSTHPVAESRIAARPDRAGFARGIVDELGTEAADSANSITRWNTTVTRSCRSRQASRCANISRSNRSTVLVAPRCLRRSLRRAPSFIT